MHCVTASFIAITLSRLLLSGLSPPLVFRSMCGGEMHLIRSCPIGLSSFLSPSFHHFSHSFVKVSVECRPHHISRDRYIAYSLISHRICRTCMILAGVSSIHCTALRRQARHSMSEKPYNLTQDGPAQSIASLPSIFSFAHRLHLQLLMEVSRAADHVPQASTSRTRTGIQAARAPALSSPGQLWSPVLHRHLGLDEVAGTQRQVSVAW